jgi:hypothetical protein
MLGSTNMQNFQLEIIYIQGCAKITNTDLYSSEQYKFSTPQNLSNFAILWILEYRLFRDEILQVGRTQHCLHLDFYIDFSKLQNTIYEF